MAKQSLVDLTRPQTLDEIIGCGELKEVIRYSIEGAKKLNHPFEHFIIVGPPGTSKSTLAGIIANLTGGQVYKILGTQLKSEQDIIDIVQSAVDNDVCYVEEAHAIGKHAQTTLLEVLENCKILSLGNEHVSRLLWLFPTTNPGKLSKPLRERCKTLHTSFYAIEELEQILINAANKLEIDLTIDPKGLRLLAESSRGTPRIAVAQRLDSVVKVMAVDEAPFSLEIVQKTLKMQGIGPYGLDAADLKYCNVLYEKMKHSTSGCVSLGTMSKSLGLATDVIDIIEQFLLQINCLNITTSGRSLTDFGLSLIGKKNQIVNKVITTNVAIDKDKIKTLLDDPEIRKKGIRAICKELNLPYPQSIGVVRSIIEPLGYKSVKKAGIIPI